MEFIFPPLPPEPIPTAPAAEWKAYTDAQWLRYEIAAREKAAADLQAHRARLEDFARRQVVAIEALAAGAEVEFSAKEALRLLADRTSSTSSAATTAKEIADSVADTAAVIAAVKVSLSDQTNVD